jgi:hypothetical protein
MSTVFIGQRYPAPEPCGRILFVVRRGKTIMYPLGGGTNSFNWGIGAPAPIALADIDRVPGAEIVVRIATFRVTEDAVVFTIRHGQIVQYRLPPKWVDGDAFNYGWGDGGAFYAPAAFSVDCIRHHSGLIVWSEAGVTPWPNVSRGPKGYDLRRTFMRVEGLRFVVVGKQHKHVKKLPFEFNQLGDANGIPNIRGEGIFGHCLVVHNWNADIPHNPKEPSPG